MATMTYRAPGRFGKHTHSHVPSAAIGSPSDSGWQDLIDESSSQVLSNFSVGAFLTRSRATPWSSPQQLSDAAVQLAVASVSNESSTWARIRETLVAQLQANDDSTKTSLMREPDTQARIDLLRSILASLGDVEGMRTRTPTPTASSTGH